METVPKTRFFLLWNDPTIYLFHFSVSSHAYTVGGWLEFIFNLLDVVNFYVPFHLSFILPLHAGLEEQGFYRSWREPKAKMFVYAKFFSRALGRAGAPRRRSNLRTKRRKRWPHSFPGNMRERIFHFGNVESEICMEGIDFSVRTGVVLEIRMPYFFP